MGLSDPHAYLGIVEEDRGFRIEEPYRSMLGSPEPGVSSGVLTASSLTYYINHGFFNFSELFQSELGRRPMGGVMQFAPVVRFLNSAGVDTPSVDEGMARIPRPGLFYTFFGNVLIDFGITGGLVYCFVFGVFVQALWLKAKAGSLFCLMLYPFFMSVIFHFPMMDMISGGYGLFVAFDVVLAVGIMEFFRLVYRARRRRRTVLQAA
jgi:oligosaccharide repeat unit polymerase